MNLSISSTKLSILRRRLSPYFPLVKWLATAAAVTLTIFFFIRFLFPLIKSAASFISRPLTTLNILTNPSDSLKQTDSRTNILILGRGGAFHEAPDLTDTIIVASLDHKNKQAATISIPRDIWIDSMKAKINSAYYYGQQKNPGGGGFALAKDAVFQVTNLPLHYTILMDMDGLKTAVDLVGGIDVEVERSFTDEKYPLEKDNGEKPSVAPGLTPKPEDIYQTVNFEKGLQHMDGDAALKFARSRNSPDPEEGTDFARSQRQQKILIALFNKIKSKETAVNPDRIKELQRIFRDSTVTDLSDDELLALGRIGVGLKPENLKQIKLDAGTDDAPGLLINPPLSKYGQWVLVPRAADWSEIHQYIQQELARYNGITK